MGSAEWNVNKNGDGEIMVMKKQVRVGIIGVGKHGSRYARHLVNDLPDLFRLTGISRRGNAGKEQAAEWKCSYFQDWRELVVSDSVDAVISVTTPNLNPAIAALCAESGKPLLIEKPLATDYHTGKGMVELCAGKDVPLTVAQTLRYNNVICGLRTELPAFGKLFSFSACQRLEPSTLSWLENPDIAGSGVIFHTAVHMFDAIRFITGREVRRLRATAQMVLNPRLEDLLVAEILLDDNAPGILDASKVSPARAGRYEFVCEGGILQGDQIYSTLQAIRGAEVRDLKLAPPQPAILPLLKDWHLFLIGKGDNPIPAEEGLAAVKICHACRLAVSTGLWVDLADLDRLPRASDRSVS